LSSLVLVTSLEPPPEPLLSTEALPPELLLEEPPQITPAGHFTHSNTLKLNLNPGSQYIGTHTFFTGWKKYSSMHSHSPVSSFQT